LAKVRPFRNKMHKINWFLFSALTFILFSLSSCFSTKKYAYFQDLSADSNKTSLVVKESDFLLKIQPDDIINIDILSSNPNAAAPFNLNNITTINGYNNNNTEAIKLKSEPPNATINMTATNGYLVDRRGYIKLPFIGSLYVQDMTIPKLKDTLTFILKDKYITDPIVNAKISNAGVLMIGQISRPSRLNLDREKVSIFDALATSGDVTDLANTKDVLLIREKNGIKHVNHVNLRNSNIIESDNYYLRQNDIVYVPPRKDVSVQKDNLTYKLFTYFFSLVSLATLIIAISK
jgi:polysaccharide biosynthesis/export protein